MKINIESDFQPLGNPKSESASAQVGISWVTGQWLPAIVLEYGYITHYHSLTKTGPITKVHASVIFYSKKSNIIIYYSNFQQVTMKDEFSLKDSGKSTSGEHAR
jgi:hypothetical protein